MASLKKRIKVVLSYCLVSLLIMTSVVIAVPTVNAATLDTTWDFSPYQTQTQGVNLPSLIEKENFPGLSASGVNSTSECWLLMNGRLHVVGTGRLIIKMDDNSPFKVEFTNGGSTYRPTVQVSSTASGPWTTVTPTYTAGENGMELYLDGIGEGNYYLQYIVTGTNWSTFGNHGIKTISFNEYVNTTVKCATGVTVDNNMATAGDTVTITVDDDIAVKAGGITVVDADGEKVAINRVGFREGGNANKYTFTMPAVQPVRVRLEKLTASQTGANIAGLGAQLRFASNATDGIYDGVRFGTQLRYNTVNDTINIGGTDYNLVKCGTIVTRSEILENLRGDKSQEEYFTLDGWDADKNAKYLINIPQTKLYDKCDEYIEFVGGITGLKSKHYGYEFVGRGYVVAEKNGKEYTFYTDIITAVPNEIMIKSLNTKVVFDKQVNVKYYDFRECDSVTDNEFYGGATRGVFPSTRPYQGGQPSVTMRVGKNSPIVVNYTVLGGYTKSPTFYVSADKVTWKAVEPDVVKKIANGDTSAEFKSIDSDYMFFRFEFPQSASDTLWSVALQSISYNSIGGETDIKQQDLSKITDEVLARSILNEGNTARLAKVLKKAANKERIVIATIGGSITEGTGSSQKSVTSYAALFRRWWTTQYPDTPIEFYNVGRGGTNSLMHLHTVDTMLLDLNPDLVVVDFTVNDTNGKEIYTESYEALMRKILSDEKAPAVISLMMCWNGGGSSVDLHLPIIDLYDIPTISYKEAVWPTTETRLYEWSQISPDYIHPNDFGHAITAKLLTNYIEKVRDNLDEQPTEIPTLPTALCNKFDAARWINSFTTKPLEINGFYANPYTVQFGGGWQTFNGGSLKVEVTDAKNIYIMFWASSGDTGAIAEVKVDGETVATISSVGSAQFNGEGTKTVELLTGDLIGNHTIEVTITSESPMDDLIIQGLLVS